MAIPFACPSCGSHLTVKDRHEGKKARCPGCRKVVSVPPCKIRPAPEPNDQEEGWHPALWGLIGGIGVAVAALVIALVIPRGGNQSLGDVKAEKEPARQSIAHADLKPASDEALTSAQGSAVKTQLSAEALYAKASPAVVTITCKNRKGEVTSLGSGFLLKDQFVHNSHDQKMRESVRAESQKAGRTAQFAYLLTNYHVIKTAARADVILSDKTTGNIFLVLSEDQAADLALLCTMVFSSHSVPSLPLADKAPPVGAAVYAIGSPQGFAGSLSAGNVSGFPEIKPGVTWLQTTAAISPGSSGGPLMNAEGEVVGVTEGSWRETGSQSLNFAIPVSEIRRFLSAPYGPHELRPSADSNESVVGKIPSEQQPRENWTRKEKEEVAHFVLALRRDHDLILAYYELVLKDKITQRDIDALSAIADEAYKESHVVRRVVLDKMHPNLADMFKETFIPGIRIGGIARAALLRPLNANSVEAKIVEEHNRLTGRWGRWWDANHMDLEMPESVPYWDYKTRNVIFADPQ